MDQQSRTVLIVDDDPQILKLLEKMLKPQVFKILVAPRPSQALEICGREPVHLLISDIAMPEMDGNKLMAKVLQLQPEASVLLISGHYKEPASAAKAARVRFLKKPFFPSDLLAALRELLPDL
ncbi:MAG TPA: response regulator [Bryobacteraceae bacterium]|jgi:DNA-binding NtrC family response regulator|nr:response regulator [Bryobacteraceae bacterium]